MGRYNCTGQTVGEYGIVLALVAIAGISTLMFFGGAAQDALKGFAAGTQATQADIQPSVMAVAKPSLGTQGNTAPNNNASNGSSVGETATTNLTIQLGNGQKIVLPNYPNNLQLAVETNGANGATELLANQIALISEKLAQTGELSQEQLNQLANLANQGHTIANIQSTLSTGINQNIKSTSPKPLAHLSFDYNKQQFSQGAFADLIGDHSSNGKVIEGAEVVKLKQYLSTAQNNGTLSDPALNQVVSSLVSDIITIASQTKASIDESNMNNQVPSNFEYAVASKLTHMKSNSICKNGGGDGTGLTCSAGKGG